MTDRRHPDRTIAGPWWAGRRAWTAGALALAATFAVAEPVAAQASGRGFLFQAPAGSLTLRGGFDRASAGSDIFSFAVDELTLSRGDFAALTLGADLAFRITPRLDLAIGATYAGTSERSEFRHWVDQDELPIEQTTNFRRVPVTASLKAYLTPPGRTIGRFAWVPARVAPFVGAGGGAMWYRFGQQGDFVDFRTSDVFRDELTSSGWTPTAHALAGIDYSLNHRFALTGEGRYTWAKANLSDDFDGFDSIDLSGLSATAGISIRF